MQTLDPTPSEPPVLVGEPANLVPPKSPRRIGWARRRRALSAFWKTYRRSHMGMVGLVMMILFILLAVVGPFFVPAKDVSVAFATGKPFQPPTVQWLLGTDNFGRSVLSLIVVGSRISLIVGFAATVVTMVLGAGIGIADRKSVV